MAITNFIQELWSAGVQSAYAQAQVVIPTLTNTFSGTAARGNTVHIIGAVTPTIVDYADEGRTISAEALSDTEVLLQINQEKAFSVYVDDVDLTQVNGTFDAWVQSAGRALAEDSETYVLGKLLDEGTEAGTPTINSGETAKAAIRLVRKTLADSKVPAANRYLVVNPAMSDLLLAGLSDVALAGSADELRNGMLGRLYGFSVLESALLGDPDVPTAVGYHSAAVAFASTIDKVEALRAPNKFADIVRGLNVYGAKVSLPAGVAFVVAD
jgi:hypothetical protein